MINTDLFNNILTQHKEEGFITSELSYEENLKYDNTLDSSNPNLAKWSECLKYLSDVVSPQVYKTWFSSLKAISFSDNTITLQVPSQFYYEWLEEHYNHLMSQALLKVYGDNISIMYQVVIEKANDNNLEDRVVKLPATNKQVVQTVAQTKQTAEIEAISTTLNPKYTFENFVVGDNNQLACSAAKAVAKSPGSTNFKPLFIYGNAGLGKTHLVQAIGNSIQANFPDKVVVYTNSDKFYKDFVISLTSGNLVTFLNSFQKVDVLIVDDIQFLSGKTKTIEHFFHLFNDLHQNNKQIILTSDKAPQDLVNIDERLISRFKWGLTVDVHAPDVETKIAILKKKCSDDGIEIPFDVLEYIAENINTSIRELEGALIRLIAGYTLDRKELNINLAKEIVMGYNKFEPKPVSLEFIKITVSDYYKIPIELVESNTRKQEVALARQMSMYLTKKFTKLSLKNIGAGFGNRDHSTVLHSCTTINNYLDTDRKVKADYENLVNYIKKNTIID